MLIPDWVLLAWHGRNRDTLLEALRQRSTNPGTSASPEELPPWWPPGLQARPDLHSQPPDPLPPDPPERALQRLGPLELPGTTPGGPVPAAAGAGVIRWPTPKRVHQVETVILEITTRMEVGAATDGSNHEHHESGADIRKRRPVAQPQTASVASRQQQQHNLQTARPLQPRQGM
jgi:hypothetical protein